MRIQRSVTIIKQTTSLLQVKNRIRTRSVYFLTMKAAVQFDREKIISEITYNCSTDNRTGILYESCSLSTEVPSFI